MKAGPAWLLGMALLASVAISCGLIVASCGSPSEPSCNLNLCPIGPSLYCYCDDRGQRHTIQCPIGSTFCPTPGVPLSSGTGICVVPGTPVACRTP
jgi:hypothetical protein